MALPLLLLSVYYRYYRTAGPSSTGYPNIRTSAGYPFYCTGTAVYFALVVDPPWICGMGSLLESAVVGSLLRWVSRKTFLAKSPPPIPGIRR